jgi:hypothetical protein
MHSGAAPGGSRVTVVEYGGADYAGFDSYMKLARWTHGIGRYSKNSFQRLAAHHRVPTFEE